MVVTHRKEKEGWVRLQKEKVKILADNSQKVKLRSKTLFPRKYFRKMEMLANGFYRFEESNLGGLIRIGNFMIFLTTT